MGALGLFSIFLLPYFVDFYTFGEGLGEVLGGFVS